MKGIDSLSAWLILLRTILTVCCQRKSNDSLCQYNNAFKTISTFPKLALVQKLVFDLSMLCRSGNIRKKILCFFKQTVGN